MGLLFIVEEVILLGFDGGLKFDAEERFGELKEIVFSGFIEVIEEVLVFSFLNIFLYLVFDLYFFIF